jgi:hypothetical protein
MVFFTVSGFLFKFFLFFPVSGYSRVRFCFEGSAAAETETHDQKESSSCNPHTGLKQIKQKYSDLLWAFLDINYRILYWNNKREVLIAKIKQTKKNS